MAEKHGRISANYKQELLTKVGLVAEMVMKSTSSKEIDAKINKTFLQKVWNRECSQVEVALLVAFVSEDKEDLAMIKVSYAAGKGTINNASLE